MKKTWLIDPGHGGVIEGTYQTYPKKMYSHSPEEVFYEGVFNRMIRDKVIRLGGDRGLHMIDLCPTELDLPLDERADIANIYYRQYPNAVGISLHSNGGGGTGFEIFTSVGETASDDYAAILGETLVDWFETIRFRRDTVSNMWDKEDHFYILKNTKCPWILPECLFFDNYDDYKLLIRSDFQERYVQALVDFMIKSELVL